MAARGQLDCSLDISLGAGPSRRQKRADPEGRRKTRTEDGDHPKGVPSGTTVESRPSSPAPTGGNLPVKLPVAAHHRAQAEVLFGATPRRRTVLPALRRIIEVLAHEARQDLDLPGSEKAPA